MQKSTPLSSLPNMHLQQPTTHVSPSNPPQFVNDQQRRIVTQAQHASQSFTLPQNTQHSNDIMNEDNATIQDALEALNRDTSASPQATNHPSQQEIDDYMLSMQHEQQQPIAYNPDISDLLQSQQQLHVHSPGGEVDMKSKLINDILSWNDELKIALFGTAIFVFVHAFPIEKYIYKYVSLDKIPNSNMVIKAVIMFIGILVVAKLAR